MAAPGIRGDLPSGLEISYALLDDIFWYDFTQNI